MTKSAPKLSLLSLTPFQRKKLAHLAECIADGLDPRITTVVSMGAGITFTEKDYELYRAVFGIDPLMLFTPAEEGTAHESAAAHPAAVA